MSNSVKSDRLKVGYFHIPPYFYDTEEVDSNKPGLIIEIYHKMFPTLGIEYQLIRLPASRLKRMAQQQRLDLILVAHFFTHSFSEKFFCSQAIFSDYPTLYQNTNQPELTDISKLQNQLILVTQESYSFLKNYLPKDNFYQSIAWPQSMINMFIKKRAFYILDYESRIGDRLSQRLPESKYRKYILDEIPIVICINKKYPKSIDILDAIVKYLIDYQDTKEGKFVFKKYNYHGRFGE
ncbi:transporter substrate-binding domain-containing protein [Spartinivicinus poritis]|uniref:Transporter substrate-binding domain-containing protein n=1 Tax=Spartinivicinus poritis TaxID=2994640 RepID=A0ABT5ULI9_9GAMM|nr:transporter substrate-binding domain-containing protein [Spartinivicinus sp. A2-2]MDE1465899.1 transporter substrate-binding domain-containing protein [Spartinivicinus sp. A2-2]